MKVEIIVMQLVKDDEDMKMATPQSHDQWRDRPRPSSHLKTFEGRQCFNQEIMMSRLNFDVVAAQ